MTAPAAKRGRRAPGPRLSARVFGAALLVSGCASPPAKIAPQYSGARLFAGLDCRDLSIERGRAAERLVFLGLKQDRVSRDDAALTFGLPLPFGTVYEGAVERELALAKGELRLIHDEMNRLDCGSVLQ